MSQSKFAALEQFLGAYFHQDWTVEASSATEIIQKFKSSASPSEIRIVVQELHQLLEKQFTEAQLAERLLKVGCYYRPTADGRTHAEWLEWLAQELEGSGGKAQKSSRPSKH